MPDYRFRQQPMVSPLASRAIDLREHEAQIREEVAYGRQELAAFNATRQAIQEELKIKQALRKEKQVAAATAAVSKLDPQSTTYIQDYAKVMADHPYAHDDKALNDIFREQSKVNYAHLAAQVHKDATDYTSQTRQKDEAYKAGIDIEVDKQKRNQGETEQLHNKLVAQAIQNGVDVSKFTTFDENGEPTGTKWAELAGAAATAKNSAPTPGVIERYAKIQGEIKTASGMRDSQLASARTEVDPKEKKKFQQNSILEKNTSEGLQAEMDALHSQYPSLKSMATGASQPATSSSPTVTPQPQQQPPKDDSSITSLFPK